MHLCPWYKYIYEKLSVHFWGIVILLFLDHPVAKHLCHHECCEIHLKEILELHWTWLGSRLVLFVDGRRSKVRWNRIFFNLSSFLLTSLGTFFMCISLALIMLFSLCFIYSLLRFQLRTKGILVLHLMACSIGFYKFLLFLLLLPAWQYQHYLRVKWLPYFWVFCQVRLPMVTIARWFSDNSYK